MVILDSDVLCTCIPGKGDSPLVVDADTVVSLSPLKSLEVVSRWHSHFLGRGRIVQHPEFPASSTVQRPWKFAGTTVIIDCLSFLVGKTFDHLVGSRGNPAFPYYNAPRYICKQLQTSSPSKVYNSQRIHKRIVRKTKSEIGRSGVQK